MVVRSARNQIHTMFLQRSRHSFCVFHNLSDIFFVSRLQCFLEANSFRRDNVHQRTTLNTGENSLINLLGILCFAHNHTASGTTQCLMGSGCHKIRIRYGRRMVSCRNQACNVGNIYHKICPNFFCHITHIFEVDGSGISTGTCHNHFGLHFQSCFAESFIINIPFMVHAIRYKVEVFPGHIDGTTVRQMTSMIQIHTHNRIPWFQHSKIYCLVCLGTAVRLYVYMVTAKKFFGTFFRQIFHNIHFFTSAIVAFCRITLCVFIGQRGSHCIHDCFGNNVFRSNEFNIMLLSFQFRNNGIRHCAINFSNLAKI